VAQRLRNEDLTVLGLRFTEDAFCPQARFDMLRRKLGDRFEAIEINSSPGNLHGFGKMAHSVLTVEFKDEPDFPTRQAMDQVIGFFRKRLVK